MNEDRKLLLSYVNRLVLGIVLVLMFVIFIYPLILTLIVSFKLKSEVWDNFFGLPAHFQFQNYAEAWEQGHIGIAFFNSFYITIITVFFQILLSSMISFVIARMKLRFINVLYLFVTAGVMIPIHAILLPVARRAVNLGLSNTHFYLICVYIAGGIPWLVFLMSSYMQSIPETLEEASIIDGCGLFQVFSHVTFPMSRPILLTSAIIAFIGAYNELLIAMVLINSQAKKTIPLALSAFVGYHDVNFPLMTAAITISIVPTLLIYLLFQEKVEQGLTAGAVKG